MADSQSTAESFASAADGLTGLLEIANGQRVQALAMGFGETAAETIGVGAYGAMLQILIAQHGKETTDAHPAI